MRRAFALAVLLTACDPWSRWPDHNGYIDDPLWSDDLLASSDGLYVRLPASDDLVLVDPSSGEARPVDLGGAEVIDMTLAPDQRSVLVTSKWMVCEDDDPKIKVPSDCPSEESHMAYALDVVVGGVKTATLDVPPYLTAFTFSDDGTIAVAYLDEDGYSVLDDLDDQAIIDLNAVAFIDLASGTSTVVSVGFAANNIVFANDDGVAGDDKAVVLSQSSAVVVDLTTFEQLVKYPFTLDLDVEINPLDAALTPDGRYCMVSLRGESDLYKLDLQVESIDILSLSGRPSDMDVNSDEDLTLLVYDSKALVDVIDHTNNFSLESLDLDVAVTDIVDLGTRALLYNDASSSVTDVYTLDLTTMKTQEYVLENPVSDMLISDSQRYALAITAPGSNYSGSDLNDYANSRWGLGIVDLTAERALSLMLTSMPVGVALVDDPDDPTITYAVLLLEGSDNLLVVNLASPSADNAIALPEPATGLGTLPDGRFYITHEAALGLVSFLDPATNTLTTIGGFATSGMLAEEAFATREEL